MTYIRVAVYMSSTQVYIQALQWIIRHLQQDIQAIQDIINQLSQTEEPNLIIIEAEPILDDDELIQFELPSALLHLEAEAHIQHPDLDNTSQITVTNLPTQPMQCEWIQEAWQRAREWAAEHYSSRS